MSDIGALTPSSSLGLPGRGALLKRLGFALASLGARRVALLLLDLDGFRELCAAFGPAAAEALLGEVAGRLASITPTDQLLAHLGGDQFALLIEDLAASEAAPIAAARLRAVFEEPFMIADVPVRLEARVGIAVAPDHADDVDGLRRAVGVALDVAKRERIAQVVYSSARDDASPETFAMAADLRGAAARGEFTLRYQPIVAMRDGAPLRVEALIRWQHPRRGILPPARFIPLAERTGAIVPMTEWVLREAIAACASWQRVSPGLGVGVNLSAAYLDAGDLPGLVAGLLAQHRLAPKLLTVEVSEASLRGAPNRVVEPLAALRANGVAVAIDGFGAEGSSLAPLRRLELDELKIDNSIVLGAPGDESSAAIVRAAVGLGRDLGVRIVAVGVDDQRTRDMVAALGCDEAQGYQVSRSLGVDELVAWLRGREGPGQPKRRAAAAAQLLASLTPRECDVLVLMGQGVENEDIATRLSLRLVTVRGYVQNILEKLEAHSKLEAVVRAGRTGLLDLLEQRSA